MKLAISGKMGSGKSHLADKLMKMFDFKKTSFAERVKELAAELFNMKEKDRGLLINLATKMREIDPKVWINCVINSVNKNQNIVLDDLRLANEYQTLKDNNWIIIKLDINEEIRKKQLQEKYKSNYESHKIHFDSITENDVVSMADNCFDFVIRNSRDEERLIEFIMLRIRICTSSDTKDNFKLKNDLVC